MGIQTLCPSERCSAGSNPTQAKLAGTLQGHTAQKIIHRKAAVGTCIAVCGQNMIGTGTIIPQRFRCPGANKHRTCRRDAIGCLVRVLAIQSANGIYSNEDRQLIQVEVSALVDEVDRIASQAEFNRFKILTGEFSRVNPKASMWFHLGANMNQRERVYIGTMTAQAFAFRDATGKVLISLSSPEGANSAIGIMDSSLQRLSKQRADLGAYYNRLEKTAKGLMGAFENIQAAESRIRDADVAEEMVEFTKSQVLVQSGTAMLAQANMQSQSALRLLGSL